MKKFDYVKLDKLQFDMEAKTGVSGRVYETPNGDIYSSITTILSHLGKKHIAAWKERVGEVEANRISRLASARGTKVHSACERYLLNEMSQMELQMMMPDTKQLFKMLQPELDKSLNNIYSLEQALYSDELRVAGRVDCIAEWDGKLSVIDFKTSSKIKDEENIQNYFMQCTAYSIMFEEITGIPIDQIVVAIAVEEDLHPQIFVREKAKYLENTKKFIRGYHLTCV